MRPADFGGFIRALAASRGRNLADAPDLDYENLESAQG